MRTLELSSKRIERLNKLAIPEGVSNSEGTLYHLKTGNWNIDNQNLLFKHLDITEGETLSNKLQTISLIGDYEEKVGIKELIVPKHIVSVNGHVEGITVEEITNATNLAVILKNPNVVKEKKIKLLKKVGELLKKTENLENYGIHFFFNDLHEGNFLIDNETEELKAIDLDSAAVTSAYPLPSKYMIASKNLKSATTKYKMNVFGIPYPDHNSDLLCYNMMLLNTIANDKVHEYNESDYYDYITYLQDIGYGENIIRVFNNLYVDAPNENPVDYFDEIPIDKLYRSEHKVLEQKQLIKKGK